jgi:hypothetical protein
MENSYFGNCAYLIHKVGNYVLMKDDGSGEYGEDVMEKKTKKNKKKQKGKDHEMSKSCCYVADPCGCYNYFVDPCGCQDYYYVDPCCC